MSISGDLCIRSALKHISMEYIYSIKSVELEALFKILVDTCWSVYFSISTDSEKRWSRSTVQVSIYFGEKGQCLKSQK